MVGNEHLLRKQENKAYGEFTKARQIAIKNNDLRMILESTLGISKVFEMKKEFSKSLKYFKEYSQIKDSIVARQRIDQMAIMQTHFLDDLNLKEIELKDNEISLLEKEKRIDTINFQFMVFR